MDALRLGQRQVGGRLGRDPVRPVRRPRSRPARAGGGGRGPRSAPRSPPCAARPCSRRVEADDRPCARSARSSRCSTICASVAGRGRRRPAEVAVGELVGLEHAGAGADREQAGEEAELAARAWPGLRLAQGWSLSTGVVVVDVADRQRPVAADAGDHAAEVGGRDTVEPAFRGIVAVALHVGHEEAVVAGRDVGERVGPVFEHADCRPTARRAGRRGGSRGCGSRGCGGARAR